LVVRITGIASERIGMIAALASVLSLYLRFPDHCTFWIEDGTPSAMASVTAMTIESCFVNVNMFNSI
jgi:hypothetical protein